MSEATIRGLFEGDFFAKPETPEDFVSGAVAALATGVQFADDTNRLQVVHGYLRQHGLLSKLFGAVYSVGDEDGDLDSDGQPSVQAVRGAIIAIRNTIDGGVADQSPGAKAKFTGLVLHVWVVGALGLNSQPASAPAAGSGSGSSSSSSSSSSGDDPVAAPAPKAKVGKIDGIGGRNVRNRFGVIGTKVVP